MITFWNYSINKQQRRHFDCFIVSNNIKLNFDNSKNANCIRPLNQKFISSSSNFMCWNKKKKKKIKFQRHLFTNPEKSLWLRQFIGHSNRCVQIKSLWKHKCIYAAIAVCGINFPLNRYHSRKKPQIILRRKSDTKNIKTITRGKIF